MRSCYAGWSLTVALLAFSACQKEEPPQPKEKPVDAGAPGPAVDPDLANAVKSAAVTTTAAPNLNGPPEHGIFAPGAADKELPKGSPPKITLGSDGSEPRVKLGPAPKPGTKRSGTIEITIQLDPRQAAPPITLAVNLEAQKPKGDGPQPIPVVAKITGASINLPGVPPEASSLLTKLKGSRIDYQVLPNGGGVNFALNTQKDLDPQFRDTARAMSETLALVTLPFPDKPLGAGAYWMATSRDGIFGLDLVTYRMIKVEQVAGNDVTLSVNTKRYSASSTLDIDGLPPDAPRNLLEFQSPSEGTITFSAGEAIPKSGQITTTLLTLLGAPDAKQHPSLEIHTRAVISLQ